LKLPLAAGPRKIAYDTEAAMAFSLLTYVFAVGVLVLLFRKLRDYQFNKKYKLPPRIPGIPIFGNTLQLPPRKQGLWGVEMARKYGEM
jgi:hypothetical protein